jgi:hypothetical protein
VLRAGVGLVVAAACGSDAAPGSASGTPVGTAAARPNSPLAANAALNIWPDQITKSSAEIREAYAYAARRPASLRYIPCYCGCGASGHRDNQDCYVKTFANDGWVVLDLHGYG